MKCNVSEGINVLKFFLSKLPERIFSARMKRKCSWRGICYMVGTNAQFPRTSNDIVAPALRALKTRNNCSETERRDANHHTIQIAACAIDNWTISPGPPVRLTAGVLETLALVETSTLSISNSLSRTGKYAEQRSHKIFYFEASTIEKKTQFLNNPPPTCLPG